MAFVVDSTTDSTPQTNVNTQYSFNHTCSADATLLVVTTHANDSASGDANVTGISYGGQPLTPGDEYFGTADDLGIEIWYKIGPLTGTNAVQVTHGGKCSYSAAVATSFETVGATVVKDANANNTGNSTAPTITVNTANHYESILIGAFTYEEPATDQISCADTSLGIFDLGGQTYAQGMVVPTGGGNHTVNWTNDVAENWVTVGVSFYTASSPSASISPSISPSPSSSVSPSASLSPSLSPSISPSPSPGWQGYTRGDESSLPTTDSDLETDYSAGEITNISANNSTRVAQTATGQFAIHQFKDYTVASSVSVTWDGQTDYAPSTSTVYLQVYNYDTPGWETKDSDNTTAVNTDFTLTSTIADTTNYLSPSSHMTWRVYQEST